MRPLLEQLDLIIVSRNVDFSQPDIRGNAPVKGLEDERWQYYLYGPWNEFKDCFFANFGIVDNQGNLSDGFSIRLDTNLAQIKIIPAGLGQLRCYVGAYNHITRISSYPLPYVSNDDLRLKGNFINAYQVHSLDWANYIGGGQVLRHGEEFCWKDGAINRVYSKSHYPYRTQSMPKVETDDDAKHVLVKSLSEAVTRAIGERKKVALHISGGIDSAAIAACAAANNDVELKIFSWDSANKTANEARYVREIAKKLDLQCTLVRPDNEYGSYDPDTFEDTVNPYDISYNPFRYLVGAVLQCSVSEGFRYGLNGNAGDNVVALPAYFAMVEAWQNRKYAIFFEMLMHLVGLLGFSNLNKVQAFRYWIRMLQGRSLISFPVEDDASLKAMLDYTTAWPNALESQNPKHAAYWKLTCADGLFPLASALSYSYSAGCFAHTPYFDYKFILQMQRVPGYMMNRPYRFKLLSRSAFEGTLPDSITLRSFRSGNLNPIMDEGYRKNRLKLQQYLLDRRSTMPDWRWWDELEALLGNDDGAPIRGAKLAFLHRAIVRVASIDRNFDEMRQIKV